MDKQEFITCNTTGKCAEHDPKIIQFIADIVYDPRNLDSSLWNFFRAGYCYYFAVMLQTAFGGGTICHAEPLGHIVWVDANGCAYDIEGAYLPEEHDCRKLTDIAFLGDLIYDFLHVPGKEFRSCYRDFHDWAEFMYLSDTEAVVSVYLKIPEDSIDYSNSVEGNAYAWWVGHKNELQEQWWEKRKVRREKSCSTR